MSPMRKFSSKALLVMVAALALHGFANQATAQQGPVLVVVVAKTSKIDSVSKADLRRVFTGQANKLGSENAVPFNLPPNAAERTLFDKVVLGMSPKEVGDFWVDQRIRGQAAPPKTVPSVDVAVKVAGKFPGAITYLPADKLTPDLKAVRVDGKAHTEPGYSLR